MSARWSSAEEAQLAALLLKGKPVERICSQLRRSRYSVELHLRQRGWPTPGQLAARPGFSDRIRVELIFETPMPPVPHHHHRRLAAPPEIDVMEQVRREQELVLDEVIMGALTRLPPPARMRQWARMVGLTVHDHSHIPVEVARVYATTAPPELQEAIDPATERQAARRWARLSGRDVGHRGRLPAGLLEEYRAAGRPGVQEALQIASAAHVRSNSSGGLVVVDPQGLRHRTHAGTEPALTYCGQRVGEDWSPEPSLVWAKAGALRCLPCREDATD